MDFDDYFQAIAPTEWANTETRAKVQALYPTGIELSPQSAWGIFYGQAVVYAALDIYETGNIPAGQSGPTVYAKNPDGSERKYASAKTKNGDEVLTKWAVKRAELMPLRAHRALAGYP